jgi:hypothetical protein
MPTFSKALEGLEGVPGQIFTTIKNMQRAIDSEEILSGQRALEVAYSVLLELNEEDMVACSLAKT